MPIIFGLAAYLSLTKHPSLLEGAAAAWAIGWAAVNLISFLSNQYLGIPLDGSFYASVSVALAGVGLAGVAWHRDRLQRLIHESRLDPVLARGLGLGILLLFVGFLLFVLYKALIVWPAHPDELIYHMELPRVAWQTGFIPLQPGLDLVSEGTAYPDLLVTQQIWVYLGAGAFDPNLLRPIMPIYTALLVLLVFSDARRWFDLPTAGVATATLLSLFSFSSLTFLMMDDVPVALYSFLGVHFLLKGMGERRAPYVAGLFLGFAGLVKYDGLAAMVALGLALTLAPHWQKGMTAGATAPAAWKTSAQQGGAFFLAAVPSTLPLLVRNLIRLGNPLYPFFFGGTDNQAPPALSGAVNIGAIVPELLTTEAVSLLGTVLVAAVLLGIARHHEWKFTERLLVLFALFYLPPYLAIPLLGSQIRYLAPLLPALAVLAGRQLMWWLWESRQREKLEGTALFTGLVAIGAAIVAWGPFYNSYGRAVAAMNVEVFAASAAIIVLLVFVAARRRDLTSKKTIAIGLILVLLVPGVLAVADEKSEATPLSWTPILLPQPAEAYLSVRLYPDWAMWTWMNANLGANATVLSFEPRVFYIDARVVSAMSPEMIPTYSQTLAEATAYLRSHGIGYVLDSAFGDGLFLNSRYVASSPIFQNLTDPTAFRLLHTEGTTALYAVL